MITFYISVQSVQENEDEDADVGSTSEISEMLGDKEHLYPKILYLVMADTAYSEGTVLFSIQNKNVVTFFKVSNGKEPLMVMIVTVILRKKVVMKLFSKSGRDNDRLLFTFFVNYFHLFH